MTFFLFLTLLIGAGPFAVVGALAALAMAAGLPQTPRRRPQLRLVAVRAPRLAVAW